MTNTTEMVRDDAHKLYLLLSAMFITALIVCNLIANKFVSIDLGFKTFVVSAGVLPYPITFLITDILSEIYGRRLTNRVVLIGFSALLFTLFILWLGSLWEAIPNSMVSDELYQTVYGNSWRVILASMVAYLMAQFVDVRLFHFWKKLTKGKHLWFRNNASTVLSQLVDTTLVVAVLFAGKLPGATMVSYIVDGWLIKSMMAALDTPLIYLTTWVIRRRLKLGFGEETSL